MNSGSIRMELLAASLAILAISCRTGPESASPTQLPLSERSDSRWALVIKDSTGGQVTHQWMHLSDINLVLNGYPAAEKGGGQFVPVSAQPRDCHAEYQECLNECMSRPLPRGYGHITRRGGLGGKEDYCNRRCIQPYRDCLDLQDLKPQEFSTSDTAVNWLREHYQGVLVGSVVIIAGVAFVVVAGGPGLLILAPAVLLSDSSAPVDARPVVASP